MIFGAFADDVTGATDLASLINRSNKSVILSFGIPRTKLPQSDAVILATKSRMAPVEEAKTAAAEAASYFSQNGVSQIYFKYCSTFDSTEHGNIGPVAELLLSDQGQGITLACPSYPAYGRTVYQGHLFVGAQLLAESSMRHHPLTPMTDSNLVRFLGKQCKGQVGLLPLQTVEEGPGAIKEALDRAQALGQRILVADAITDRHISTLAQAAAGMRVMTGGAAFGSELAARQPTGPARKTLHSAKSQGPVALLSGSCSAATLAQVKNAMEAVPSRLLDPVRLLERGTEEIAALLDWAVSASRRGNFLIYSTAESGRIRDVQQKLGIQQAGTLLEDAFGDMATGLAGNGVRKFVVAGGETSGAVIRALQVRTLVFGAELDQGVPWTHSLDPEGYTFALKSGNFGGPDFFLRAIA